MRALSTNLKALADETRLAMLGLLLREGELCVCDFVEVLGITQSKASRHLRHLVRAGLLQDRRDAVWVHFRVADRPGAVPRATLAALRRLLPPLVPGELLARLEAWRRRKARAATCCGAPVARRPARRRRR